MRLRDRLLLAASDRLRSFAVPGSLSPAAPPLEVEAAPARWSSARPIPVRPVGRALTPERVAAYLQAADEGFPAAMCELIEEIEDRDGHLVSILGTRRRAVAGLPWRIKPVDDRRSSLRVAALVEARLKAIKNFEDGLLDLMQGVSTGFGVVELDWYNTSAGAGVRSMEYRPPRWFRPSLDDPSVWRVADERSPFEGRPLTPYRFLVHTPKAKAGFPVRAGLGRVCVWWYLFKNYAVKDWASYAETFGAPLRVGKYPAGAKPADIAALESALSRLGVDAFAVYPADMQIDFVGDRSVRSGPEVYEALAARCDREMSKAVLGQTLTTEEGRSGTRAQGQVHDEVRQDLVRSDARQLASTIQHGLVEPLVLFHFGNNAPPPTFEFCLEPAEDAKVKAETQKLRADVIAAAARLGVPVPLSVVQAELGIRAPLAEEPLLEAAPTGPAPAVPARLPPLGQVVLLADPPPVSLPPLSAELEVAVHTYRTERGPRAWRALVEAVLTQLGRVGSYGELDDAFVALIEQLDLGDVAGALADATLAAELVGRLQVEVGDRVSRDVPAVPPAEAIDFWTREKRVVTPAEFDTLAAEHRSRAFTVAGFTSLTAIEEIRALAEQSLRDGSTFADFQDGMEAALDRAGLGPRAPWRIETVFRNATGTAYAVGRDRQQRTPAQLAARPYWRYHAIDDGRMRPEHLAQDGKVYRYDHPFWAVWSPPNGHQCRCYRTAHSAAEVQAMGWVVEEDLPVDPANGGPMVPDQGWDRDPARAPHEFDWSPFPPTWRQALGVAA